MRTLLLAALTLSLASSAWAAAPLPEAQRPTVAVLYFDAPDKPEEYVVLKKGLAQMIITDLVPNTSLRVVEREKLQAIMDELKLNQTNKIDPATANKIGKLLGVKYQVIGAYFLLGPMMRVDAKVIEVVTGKTIGS
ncbi:MAG: CsgG/HfaB family protein, partial [Myxococcaceae bacterium]